MSFGGIRFGGSRGAGVSGRVYDKEEILVAEMSRRRRGAAEELAVFRDRRIDAFGG